jgi:hypothetical protein
LRGHKKHQTGLKATDVDKKIIKWFEGPNHYQKVPEVENSSLVPIPVNPGFEARTLQTTKLSKRERVNNEEEFGE